MDVQIPSNPILVAQSISKLVTKIKKNVDSSAADIKYLKDKCISSDDPSISLAASKGLVLLAECDILQTTSLLSELVSSLPLARCYAGITAAVCELLFLDAQRKISFAGDDKYESLYNLRTPQHPLISIFIRSPNTCFDILTKIKYFYLTGPKEIINCATELHFAFYMYILCNPTADVPNQFQLSLWDFITSIEESKGLNIIPHVIVWLQTASLKQTLQASQVVMIAIDKSLRRDNCKIIEILVLLLASIISEIIRFNMDPRQEILYLYGILRNLDNTKTIASSILIILTECLPVCPLNYLEDLLRLCLSILQLQHTNKFTLHALKASVVQWMAYGCLLTSQSLNIATQILLNIESSNESSSSNTNEILTNQTFLLIKNTNQCIHSAVELNQHSETVNACQLLEWLDRFEKVPAHILKKFYSYYISLLLFKDLNTEVTSKVIKILLRIASEFKETTTQLLTLFLYRLSNETDSRIHFELLKALPKMAVLKENLPLVLNTFELFRKGMSGIKSYVLTLFYELWNANEKCYLYLQNVLATPEGGGSRSWEFYTTKAHVIKEICLKRPELHGKELLGHLSEILNKCTDENGGLATALSIDSIKVLCKMGIVDINSAWDELSPQFKREKRVIVLKSLCSFMAEVSYFESSECSASVMDDILATLWQIAINSESSDVVAAAYDALACFTLEQLSEQFPDKFKIVSTHLHNTLGFSFIPGRYWLNLLLHVQEFTLTSVADLLIKLVAVEISSYKNSTYIVSEGQREPQNYVYLPEQSIVRALENNIRSQVGNWNKSPTQSVYIQCLRILSQEYSKPLPPVDWCFLQELVHIPESRSYCITIASHQVQLSGTARRLVENFLTALQSAPLQIDDIETIYRNLKYLCNSIQPMTLRPFIEGSVKLAFETAENTNDLQILDKIVLHLCNTLKDENLQDVNRMMLSQVILPYIKKMDLNSPVFDTISECITALPIRYIDELSSPRLWQDPSELQIKMSIRFRCVLALKATVSPLTWINDLLDIEHLQLLHYTFFFKNLIKVLEHHRDSDFASSWVMELLGNIQSTLANKFMTAQHLKFLCDVFILSVVVLSGNDLYVNDVDQLAENSQLRLRFAPQSIAELVKLQNWKPYTTQIAEWLYHIVNNALTPNDYKIAFFSSLAALKHEDVFQKTPKWMSYVGVNIPLINT